MVVDQNFLKVKRTLVTIFLFTLFINYSFADNLKFKKIVNLKGPWGSTFINDTELLITEKSGNLIYANLETNNYHKIIHEIPVASIGQGGLLDIKIHDGYLYVSFSIKNDNDK